MLLRGCLWTRAALTTLLFVFVGLLSSRKDGVGGALQVTPFLVLLLCSYAFSVVTALFFRVAAAQDLLVKLQVLWDLLFTVVWVYSTGGTGSLFIFLYLFVIMEASILLGLYGTILVAFLCGLFYWMELHFEYHWALFPKTTPIAAPLVTRPAAYPVANLIFILTAMASAAWLTGALKQRFSKTHLLLREKTESIQDLLHLNESIVRCIRSGLITLDRDRRITSANQAAAAITLRSREELLGRRVEDLLGSIPLEELDLQDTDSPVPFRWEQPFVRKDGKTLLLGCSGAVLRDHREERFGHLIVFQDLTTYRRMEEDLRRKEKLAAVGEMAAGLAHEIRNPLASLYGSIQLLQGELDLEGTQRRLMEIVLKESERLDGLIRDFLLFAFPQAGEREPVLLREVVEETLEIFRRGPHFHDGVRLEVEMAPAVRILGDRRQIRQVLWNLLLNAVQAMPPEGGRIKIGAVERRSAAGGTVIRWRVEDSGKGIPTSDLKRIFDPFYTTRRGGTGLGLSIVHRILENHGGTIRVSSREGRGTTFEMELPADRPGEASAENLPARPGTVAAEPGREGAYAPGEGLGAC